MRSGVSALLATVERALATGEGSSHLSRLDAALEAVGLNLAERGELLQMRARVHREAMAWQLMLADARAAEEAFAAAGDDASQAQAVALVVLAAGKIGDPVMAADTAVRVRTLMATSEQGDPRLYNRLALFCYDMFAYEEARTWCERGLQHAQGEENEPARVLLTHNIVELYVTDLRLREFESTGSTEPRGGEDQARELRRMEELTRWLCDLQLPGQPLLVDGPRLLGLVLCAQGRAAEAVQLMREALPRRDATSSAVAATGFDAAFGWALLRNGEAAEAVERLETAVQAHEEGPVHAESLLARLDLGEALEAVGRHTEAVRTSREGMRTMVSWLRTHGRSVLRQVDEQAQMRALAAELSSHLERDPLTGAGNRRRLETAAASLARESSVGVCLLDLDRFKQVNDLYGHAVGDAVLVAVVETVKATCRDGDEVVRLGGEEFVVLLPGAAEDVIADAAERIRTAVTHYPWSDVRPELQMTVSVGWAAGAATELHHTIEAADQALLVAKRAGRNRCEPALPPLASSAVPVRA